MLAVLAVGLAGSLAAGPAGAGTVVMKPGLVNTTIQGASQEFGRTLARSSGYTVVASMQENIPLPGELVPNTNYTSQGGVYLFNDNFDFPERTYQYPGMAHFQMHAGARVAISERWMAFASTQTGTISQPGNAAVFVVGKSNGQWAQCPSPKGIVDCSGITGLNGSNPTPAIVQIPFPRTINNWSDMTVAISDNTLAMADNANSNLWVYRFNDLSGRWKLEFQASDSAYKHMGTAIAIDGDRIAVSSTFRASEGKTGLEPDNVRILQRSPSTGIWSYSGIGYGWFSDGDFGRHLAMRGGNLVVGGGADHPVLAFYQLRADGSLSAPFVTTPVGSVRQVAISGITAAVTTSDTMRTLVVYKRDSIGTGNTWKQTTSLDGRTFAARSYTRNQYSGEDEIGLDGNKLSLGWRGYGFDANNSLIGAFIRERVDQIDACAILENLVRNCSFDIPGSTAWQLLAWQGASASASYAGGEMKTSIQSAGSDFWHIQVRTAVSLPAARTYNLKFRAKTPGYRTMVVNLGHNGTIDNNWTSYGRVRVDLGPNATDFSFDFPSVPADTDAVLDFNLGNAGVQPVTLDDVVLSGRP